MKKNGYSRRYKRKKVIPAYLENLIKAVMELHEVTETLKSRSFIQLKSGKGTTKKTEVLSGYWLYRKMGVHDECRNINLQCRRLAGKIRFWLGYYDSS